MPGTLIFKMRRTKKKRNDERMLAIDPTHRGFAYVVFEGPNQLVDWGLTHVSGRKNPASLRRATELIRLWDPEVIVLEEYTAPGSRRRGRTSDLIRRVHELALEAGIKAVLIPPRTVKAAFANEDATTKEEIARVIAERYPVELGRKLPPHRKIWMSEDLRINLFDAAALALGYCEVMRRKRGARRRKAA